MSTIKITDYSTLYQQDIDHMMLGIQSEFPISITSPQSTRIYEVYQLEDQKFWVALHEDKVVGTIGLSLFSNHSAVLKRMMVDKNYRGSSFNTASLLLQKSVDWAREQGIQEIYLGTMEQFKAAQQFYLKKGFTGIDKKDLPADYEPNPIDSLFYKISLT